MYMTEDASGYWIGAFELMNKHQHIQTVFPANHVQRLDNSPCISVG